MIGIFPAAKHGWTVASCKEGPEELQLTPVSQKSKKDMNGYHTDGEDLGKVSNPSY